MLALENLEMRKHGLSFVFVICVLLSNWAYAHFPFPTTMEGTPTLAPLLDQVAPAIVSITTRGQLSEQDIIGNPLFNDPFFLHLFDYDSVDQVPRETQNIGSGVIIDAKRGYVVTNQHVVERANDILITLHDNRRLKAELVGADKETDIALLKIIEPANLTQIEFGDPQSLRVGDYVVAIGNPFGLGHSVTAGIISGLGRTGLGIEGYEDFIQTDASINPGNSGGALINLNGELVGINTAIYSQSGGSVGVSFAIPINMVNSITAQLIEFGSVKRGRLGVFVQALTPQLADVLKVKMQPAALVAQVTENSPAFKAGLEVGDIILLFNDKPVVGGIELHNLVGLLRLGDKISFNILRGGKQLTLTGALEDFADPTKSKTARNDDIPALQGVEFDIAGSIGRNNSVISQVIVAGVRSGTHAYAGGLRSGDVILTVNGKTVSNIKQLFELAKSSDENLLLNVQRSNGALFLVIAK